MRFFWSWIWYKVFLSFINTSTRKWTLPPK